MSICLSVRPSVCPSHPGTEWKRRKLGSRNLRRRIAQLPKESIVFGMKNSSRNSKGFIPSEGVKWEWGRKNSQFSANKSQYSQTTVELSRTAIFSVFAGYFWNTLDMRPVIGFSVIPKCMALNGFDWLFRVKFCFRVGLRFGWLWPCDFGK